MTKLTIDKTIKNFLVAALLVLAFVERSAGSVPLHCMHIEYNKGYALLTIAIVTLVVLLLFKNKCQIDKVAVLLLIKSVLDLIRLLSNKSFENKLCWYYFSMVIFMPLIYFIFKQYKGSLSTIVNYLSVFGILLVVQTIVTIIINGYSYFNILYKEYLRIPLAHSNIIGAIILSILFIRILSHKNGGANKVINLFYVVGLILLKSVGSMLFLIIWFFVTELQRAKERKKYLRICISIFCGIIVFSILLFSTDLQNALFSTSFDNFDISIATSRRTDIWILAINQWLKHPILGNGLGVTEYNLGFEIVSTGVHNIIIDYAVQSGIVGVVLYGSAVVKGLKAKRYDDFPERRGLMLGIIILLMYSMLEVCYFHYAGVFFFWMYMGLYNAKLSSCEGNL